MLSSAVAYMAVDSEHPPPGGTQPPSQNPQASSRGRPVVAPRATRAPADRGSGSRRGKGRGRGGGRGKDDAGGVGGGPGRGKGRGRGATPSLNPGAAVFKPSFALAGRASAHQPVARGRADEACADDEAIARQLAAEEHLRQESASKRYIEDERMARALVSAAATHPPVGAVAPGLART